MCPVCVCVCVIRPLPSQITQATQRSDSMSGVEAVYHVVNKMVLMSDNIQVARESSLTQEEESAYDTLENVLKSMRTEGHTPYSPTRTEGGHRSMVPQPQQGKPATPPQARSPLSRENQAQGLQSTVSSVWCVGVCVCVIVMQWWL